MARSFCPGFLEESVSVSLSATPLNLNVESCVVSKKQKVTIKKDDNLDALDQELDMALVNLRDVTERVTGLLESIESPGQPPAPAAEEEAEETAPDAGAMDKLSNRDAT